MRTVSYVVLGGVGGEFPQQGTVADLLLAVPYLLTPRLIPPLHIVNDLLAKGIDDAGMSGGVQWEPFQITQSEWDALAQHLTQLPDDESCEFVPPADWVQTIDDWSAWVMIHRYGYPEEFRELDREVRELERARKEAVREGNESLVLELHLRCVEAGNRLAEFVMAHRPGKPRDLPETHA